MSDSVFAPDLKLARALTLIAVLPQLLLLYALQTDGQASWTAPAAAFAYAAFIFSFLGGYYWGVALLMQPQKPIVFVVGVSPMLISFTLFLPWLWGWNWPGPQLIVLGIAIMLSFLVDWRMLRDALPKSGWLSARLIASFGLGITTTLIGLLTRSSAG